MYMQSPSRLSPAVSLRSRVSRQLSFVLTLWVSIICLDLVARGSGWPSQHVLASAKQSAETPDRSSDEVMFTIKLKDGKTRFHPGEVISVELQFSSSVPDTYQLSQASYDRSGRLEIDQYHVEPASSISDPLLDYYRNSPWGGFIGAALALVLPWPRRQPSSLPT